MLRCAGFLTLDLDIRMNGTVDEYMLDMSMSMYNERRMTSKKNTNEHTIKYTILCWCVIDHAMNKLNTVCRSILNAFTRHVRRCEWFCITTFATSRLSVMVVRRRRPCVPHVLDPQNRRAAQSASWLDDRSIGTGAPPKVHSVEERHGVAHVRPATTEDRHAIA